MTRRLRRFIAVGLVITAVHVVLLQLLVRSAGLMVVVAASIAVAVAAVISFLLHRRVTFADDPHALVDHRPRAFALAVGPAAVVDVAIVTALTLGVDEPSVIRLLLAQAPALAAASVVRLLTYRRVLFASVRADQSEMIERPQLRGGVRTSVVVPVFREPERIGPNLARLRKAIDPAIGPIEIVVVDDGSDDDTPDRAHDGGADKVLVQPENRGKGAAVRRGMLAATGRTVVFTDADLAYPPEQLVELVCSVEDGWDVVVGNRRHPDAVTREGPARVRELGSLVFNLVTHAALLGHYRDTQCGMKAFRRDVARSLFARATVDGFAFDVEVLHLVEKDRLSLHEVPAILEDDDVSTISVLPVALRMIRDVIRVRRRSSRGAYDLGRPVAEALAAADGAEYDRSG
ncbi:MAG: glycosyltransferase [Actinomycetota bacterium]